MKYVCYTRVSKEDQNSGTSPEEQKKICLKRVGNLPHLLYEDTGRGWKDLEKRATLLDAIASIEKGDVLLVPHPDRLARNSDTIALVKYQVRKRGGRVEFADGSPSTYDTEESIIMTHVQSMVAMLEKKTLGRRMKAAHQTKKARKEAMGFVPYGWKQQGKCRETEDGMKIKSVLVTHPEEQQIIRRMREYRAGGMSYRTIATHLNELGFFNREGKPWHHHSIYRILKTHFKHV